jgi:RNA polymerase sigma factor (sigma-70 family)
MTQETTRETLLSRVRDPSDAESWRQFDRHYRELILRACRRHGARADEAEDVRQAVMLRLSNTLRHFVYRPELGRFRDYLRRCVRNELANRARQRRSAPPLEVRAAEDLPAEPQDGFEQIWEEEWRAHHLRQAMNKARAAFEPQSLHTFDRLLAGESREAVARSLGVTPDTVYRIQCRVRDFLRERVREQLAGEELPSSERPSQH